MSLSAEDLLKTKTVPELIGSKYHDFVESADTIKKMLIASTVIDECVTNIWKSKIYPLNKLIINMNEKYNSYTSKSNVTSFVEVCQSFPYDSKTIWFHLENKNISQATKVCIHNVIICRKLYIIYYILYKNIRHI